MRHRRSLSKIFQDVVKSRCVEGLHCSVCMETREHNTSWATLDDLDRFAHCRGKAYRKLRAEPRQEQQAELAKEKEEARKARELRDARRIHKDEVLVAVGASQARAPGSQVRNTLPGAEDRC